MHRAEYLLAKTWNRVQGGILQKEGVLEDALPWASRSKKGERMNVDTSHERLVWWISHQP